MKSNKGGNHHGETSESSLQVSVLWSEYLLLPYELLRKVRTREVLGSLATQDIPAEPVQS